MHVKFQGSAVRSRERSHCILGAMGTEGLVLQGRHIRLEPLDHGHVDGLGAAAAVDPSLYQWSPVPQGKVEATKYVETALAWREAGTAVPFAIVRLDDGVVIGSTRFWKPRAMGVAAGPSAQWASLRTPARSATPG